MRKILRAMFIVTVFSALTRLGGFLFRVYLSRTIGAEGMGIYQITMSVFSLLVTLTSSGIPLVVSKRTAELNKNKLPSHGTVSAALIISLIVSTVAVLIVFFGQNLLSKIFTDRRNVEMLIVLLPAVVVSSFYSVFRGGLWGKKKFFTYGLIEFFEQYIRVGIGIVMLQGVLTLTQGTMRAALSLSISYIIAAIVAGIVYFAAGEKLASPRHHLKPVIKSAAPITALRIAGSLIGSLIAIIIPLRLIAHGFDRQTAVSQFGVVSGMAMPLLSIPITLVSSLALAIVPELSSIKDKKELNASINNAIKVSIFLGGLFVAFFFVVGQDVSQLIYKNTLAGEIVKIGAFSVIPTSLALISSNLLNSLGLELKALKCYMVSSAVLLLSVWFLPRFFGIEGMLFSSIINALLISALNIFVLNKTQKVAATTLKSLGITAALIVPIVLICHLMRPLLLAIMPVTAVIVVICLLSGVLYILTSCVFDLVDIGKMIKIVKEKKQAKAKKIEIGAES